MYAAGLIELEHGWNGDENCQPSHNRNPYNEGELMR
jgi:hypothetical protein